MSYLVKPFLTGGLFVAGISFIGNKVDPILAGLLAGLPIGLPSTYFISDKKAPKYVLNLAYTTILLTIVTILYTFIYVIKHNTDKNTGIIISMSVWFVLVSLIYIYQKYK